MKKCQGLPFKHHFPVMCDRGPAGHFLNSGAIMVSGDEVFSARDMFENFLCQISISTADEISKDPQIISGRHHGSEIRNQRGIHLLHSNEWSLLMLD